MIRVVMLVGVSVLALASCQAGGAGRADSTNAVAAYIHVSEDRREQNAVIEALAHAVEGEPSSLAGFVPGLRAAGSQQASNGVYGWEFIFQPDVTQAQRQYFADRAETLQLEIVWLHADDEWPWCSGDGRCLKVKQSGDFN